MSLEGGGGERRGRRGEGMGREERGGEGRGGEGRGGEGRGGEGRGGMTVIHGPQYLNSDHVTYYVITCKSAFDWVYTEQWYVIITSDVTWTE